MKKLLIAVLSFATIAAYAQKTTPKKTTTTTKTTAGTGSLKNLTDSASYAIGISVANFYKQQGMKSLNGALISKAINDVYKNQPKLIKDEQLNTVIMKCMDQADAEKAKTNITAGENFLAANKKRSGVKTTPSGLQYEVITEGTGPKPKATDTVKVNYMGTLIDGTEFDNSYKRGQPIEFPLDRVIPGWTEGVQLMSVGSKYKFYIPYQLGYGTHGNQAIPGGSTLVFTVELLGINGK